MILFVTAIHFPCCNSRLSLITFVRKENSVVRTTKADVISAGTNCVILIYFLPEMVCCHTTEVVTLMWCLKFCSLLSLSVDAKNKRDNCINNKPSKQALFSPVFQASMRLHSTVLVMIVMIKVLDNHAFSWQALFSQTKSGKYSWVLAATYIFPYIKWYHWVSSASLLAK